LQEVFTPGTLAASPPTRGQYTEETLEELGIGPEELAELQKNSVV